MTAPFVDGVSEVRLWEVSTNTDLTEGRGRQYPIAWSTSYSAAKRRAHKQGVMGTDAEVSETTALCLGGRLYVMAPVEVPTDADRAADQRRQQTVEIIGKARAAGLTDAEILILRNSR